MPRQPEHALARRLTLTFAAAICWCLASVTSLHRNAAATDAPSASAPAALGFHSHSVEPVWQYVATFNRPNSREGKPQNPGKAKLWLPPLEPGQPLRGVMLMGQLGIEAEMVRSPEIRDACRSNGLAIVYFEPHISGVFHYWNNPDEGKRLLDALAALAKRSGRPELDRLPWVTVGHSTSGIFCRNVAYWQPSRVAGIIHNKSGNFHQADHLPPEGKDGLAGIPLLAINGQFEVFGPEGGIRPEWGRETQWVFVRQDIERFRTRSTQHLMTLAVHPGADHFHSSRENHILIAAFIDALGRHRLPLQIAPGSDPISARPIPADSGLLIDRDLYKPELTAWPLKRFTGDPAKAFWLIDEPFAKAYLAYHRNLAKHQALASPQVEWLDEGDGWAFKVSSRFLTEMPEEYGGKVGGLAVTHAKTPIEYRAKSTDPVVQIGPDRFRLLKPLSARQKINVAAFNPGDHQHRSTIRWAAIDAPQAKGDSQHITFELPSEIKLSDLPLQLKAQSSAGLDIYFEVDHGPIRVRGATLHLADWPAGATTPIECRVTAWQIGRRSGNPIAAAQPATVTFSIRP